MKRIPAELQKFRLTIYNTIKYRRDAIMELIDAFSSYSHHCKSIVELSEAPCFTRKYTSVTDAIADGSITEEIDPIRKIIIEHVINQENSPLVFGMDVTPCPRPYAEKLEERSFVYAPNSVPGQKPVTIGHNYSVLAALPQNMEDKDKHWIAPISVVRVKNQEKGPEVGMHQLHAAIKALKNDNQLIVNVGDCAYGSEACRKSAAENDHLVHLYRIANNRNVFDSPDEDEVKQKKYGNTMKLNDNTTHGNSDEETSFSFVKKNGDHCEVEIKRWNNMRVRGSRNFKSYEHPIDLIQARMRILGKNGKVKKIYQRPMWLALFGKRRCEVDMISAFKFYQQRFDLEHFFRFGKTKLLLVKYQTPDVDHEEALWNIGLLAYLQLFLARGESEIHLKDWEKYLPSEQVVGLPLTPTQTQRGFQTVLDNIGSPALPAKRRGRSPGRKKGESIKNRKKQEIQIKAKNVQLKPICKLSGFGKADEQPNHQSLVEAMKTIPAQLKKIGLNLENFQKIAKNLKEAA